MTLRLTDARTGRVADVPGVGRWLRLHVGGQPGGTSRPGGLDAVRLLVTADILRRLAELAGARVAVRHDPVYADLDGRAAALNVKPADGPPYDEEQQPDVLVGPPHADPPPAPTLWLAPAPASGATPEGGDPLALRLALLTTHHGRPYADTGEVLAGAGRRLARWRGLVAAWAESPSAPPHRPTVDRVLTAIADDLDTAAALAALDDLAADDDVPAGGRFETFAYADRVLALDLARDVGQAAYRPNSR